VTSLCDSPQAERSIIYIDETLFLDTDKGYIKNITTNLYTEINGTAANLMLYLLQQRNTLVSRESILENVFIKNGARPTHANLNQYISFLRKAIHQTGYEDDVIITVPRMGFRIKECHALPPAAPEASPQRQEIAQARSVTRTKNNYLSKKTFLFFVIAACVALLASIIILCIEEADTRNNALEITFTYEQCRVYFIDYQNSNTSNSPKERKIFDDIKRELNCASPKDIYFYTHENDDIALKWRFYSICEKSSGYYHCNSFYYGDEV
jgi:DNA-binding winged helix-turn-helix (wHTH) protein